MASRQGGLAGGAQNTSRLIKHRGLDAERIASEINDAKATATRGNGGSVLIRTTIHLVAIGAQPTSQLKPLAVFSGKQVGHHRGVNMLLDEVHRAIETRRVGPARMKAEDIRAVFPID